MYFLQSNEIGPGKYTPEYGGFSSKAVAKRASGPGWQREYEVSHMLALPYLLNKEEWLEKKMLVSSQLIMTELFCPNDVSKSFEGLNKCIL